MTDRRVGLSRGAEPEPLPPRGEAETPTEGESIEEWHQRLIGYPGQIRYGRNMGDIQSQRNEP